MKELISAVAVILTFVAYIPYYRDILRGKTHPHVYSWSLWGLLSVLLIALQVQGGAGSATWITVAAGLLCFGVVILSLKKGKRDITKLDTATAILSVVAMLCWLVADQPTLSILLVIIADGLAFIPTVRKSWYSPHTETLSLYVTNAFRFVLALAAVESYTFLSASWIIFWVMINTLFAIMLVVRRRQLSVMT